MQLLVSLVKFHPCLSLLQGMVLLNPEELALPPVKVPDDAPQHERVAIRGLAQLVTDCTAFSPDARPCFADVLQVSIDPPCQSSSCLFPLL